MQLFVAIVISYLIGSIPFGLLVAKMKGVDIRKVGSGNIGATNVFRCVGKAWGSLTLFLDLLKGLLPVLFLAPLVDKASLGGMEIAAELWPVLVGIFAIIGHNFPIFLKFKGGKGVATSAGVVIGLAPWLVLVGLVVWILFTFATGYVSIGSIAAAIAIAVMSWLPIPFPSLPPQLQVSQTVAITLTLLAALIIWRHRHNLVRLKNGTENRFNLRKSEKPNPT